MECDSAAAALDGGQAPAPGPSETDRIRAIYQSYDTQERWLRKRDPANPGFSELQAERWRKITGIIAPRLREVSPLRVVDVGCGRGSDLAHIAELRPDAGLFGVDLSEERVAAARRAVPGAALWVRDGDTLPFPDRSVQLMMLSTVLSSILDPPPDARSRRRPTGSSPTTASCSSTTSGCRARPIPTSAGSARKNSARCCPPRASGRTPSPCCRRWPGACVAAGRPCTGRWPASGRSAATTCRS
jgi:Methyltransferase domain